MFDTAPATICSGFGAATGAAGGVFVTAATLAANGAAVVESSSAGALAASAVTVSDRSGAESAAARTSTVATDRVTAFVVGAADEADGFLLGVGSGSAVGFGPAVSVGSAVWVGSGAWVVGSAFSVGDSGALVLPAVPVVVWALTTTPGATVVEVLASVVLVEVVSVALASASVVAGVAAGSVLGFGDTTSGPAVPAVSVDCTVPADELSEAGESSAKATPCPVAIAVPTPSTTASRPTRPT
jgi:hypothetical protein